jgi:hypothetical protein
MDMYNCMNGKVVDFEIVSVQGTAKVVPIEWKLKAFGEWLAGRTPPMIKLCMLLLTRVRNLEK